MPYTGERNPQVLTAGDLNREFTELAILFLRNNGLTYQNVNAAIGALECAKLELYRRVAEPYEEDCIKLNGDVYPVGLTQGRPNKGLVEGARK